MSEIYRAPESDLELDHGNMEDRLQAARDGRVPFSASEVLGSAWTHMKGLVLALVGAVVVTQIVAALAQLLVGAVTGGMMGAEAVGEDPFAFAGAAMGAMLLTFVLMIVFYGLVYQPMATATFSMVARRRAGLETGFTEIFKHFHRGPVLLAGMVLHWLAMALPILVLVMPAVFIGQSLELNGLLIGLLAIVLALPALYIALTLSLAQPLMLEHELGPLNGLITSYKSVRHHWTSFLGLFLVIALVWIVTALLVAAVFYGVSLVAGGNWAVWILLGLGTIVVGAYAVAWTLTCLGSAYYQLFGANTSR